MMKRWSRIAGMSWACSVLLAAPVRADCPIPPAVRLFSDDLGATFVRITPQKETPGRDAIRMYRLRGTGETLVWSGTLVNVPARAWVDPLEGWVVTMGNYCNLVAAHDHALTIYDNRGTVAGDWRLEELVSMEELRQRQTVFEVHTPWTAGASLRFESTAGELRVILPWGASRVIARKARQ